MRLEATEHRDYSTIQRRTIAGQLVYVKQCLPGCRYQTAELARAQVAREVELLKGVAPLPGLTRRLGVVKVVEHDVKNARITTAAVPGELLSDVLRRGRQETLRGTCVRALYLAGRWSRVFQTLPVDHGVPLSTPSNPEDLVEHCELRLKILMELGYPWPSETVRKQLLRWLGEQVEATPKEQRGKVWCHGDYGPFNMIWDHRVLTPIDFAGSAPDLPLADVTYLIHRLEMLPIEVPWRRWPVALWRRACLRGYGMADAQQLPIYNALMVRHSLSRLKKLVQRRPATSRQRWRDRWCRHWVRARLANLIGGTGGAAAPPELRRKPAQGNHHQ